jgi:hypothetical protein
MGILLRKDKKMVMNCVKIENNYKFYVGKDENNGKDVYNIVLEYQDAPTSGYYSKEYIEKIKGVKF